MRQKSHQRDKHLDSVPYKILGTINKMDRRGIQTDGPKDKEINDYAQSLTLEGGHIQTIY